MLHPDVLYRHETLSVSLRKDCRVKVFMNLVSSMMFEPNKDCGRQGNLCNKELHTLYSCLHNVNSRRMRWLGYMEQMKDMRNTFIKFGWEVLGISWEVWEYVRD
jgi:hypothetical protein